MDILNTLTTIAREAFENDDIEFSLETTADDVDEWNSMTHLQLISMIEKHYKVRFALGELQELKNVGEMVELIKKKTS
ncbi:MAG: acyl carrier protein [Bacteriovoracaceae bacterium]|nr:acyl carrier protein [Bacteriovoracaceae bacterium]